MRTLARPFSDQEEAATDSEGEDEATPEYVFEGFDVEFAEKITLMPAGAEKK
jgi:hypothetical protein